MISIETARQLQEAGLTWQPRLHDFFAIPDRNLDYRYFVLADMTIAIEVLHGYPAITFNGAVEWSLDYILQMDVFWVPTEEQLRMQLVTRLAGGEEPILRLESRLVGYSCSIKKNNGNISTFEADEAEEAYAQALLHLLQTSA